MTYPLLKQAPKNHMSAEFIDFVRANNTVILETPAWIVVENCKYHTKKRRHYTAFYKYLYGIEDCLDVILKKFPDMLAYINPPQKRSVRRFHIHFIDRPKYLS